MKLQFNPAKSATLFYGRSLGQARPPFKMGGDFIHCRETHAYLGVVLDERLGWDPQVEAVVAKSRGVARRVAAISRGGHGGGCDKRDPGGQERGQEQVEGQDNSTVAAEVGAGGHWSLDEGVLPHGGGRNQAINLRDGATGHRARQF